MLLLNMNNSLNVCNDIANLKFSKFYCLFWIFGVLIFNLKKRKSKYIIYQHFEPNIIW